MSPVRFPVCNRRRYTLVSSYCTLFSSEAKLGGDLVDSQILLLHPECLNGRRSRRSTQTAQTRRETGTRHSGQREDFLSAFTCADVNATAGHLWRCGRGLSALIVKVSHSSHQHLHQQLFISAGGGSLQPFPLMRFRLQQLRINRGDVRIGQQRAPDRPAEGAGSLEV
ncbi:hypothetical protein FQA47_015108 [Oryzias melastigma]|uniref:Uncharacterized protein n=1 Tax=Oryzias melastigma TaxID=30732 RepID=A0A834EZ39_ORYME|nr:hypothetical protein FQA47_015108 [Oryzias melastigma]